MRSRPWVGVPADRKIIAPHPFQAVGEKYLRALVDGAEVLPLPLVSLEPPLPWAEFLPSLDGLFLTGSYSNIEPHHYSDEGSWEGNLHDPARDATTLPLVQAAIAAGVPVLAVCRGLQEVNVALGGTLHQRVHEVPGLNDHREDKQATLAEQYAHAHAVTLAEGGLLRQIHGQPTAQVNSLHGQGIARLAPGLRVEATAPDGLVEAVSLPSASAFFLAVQWHPEWQVREDPFYLATFAAFGQACRERALRRSSTDED
ncbi:MAG: gamma-glutamyl-gamma-aminobutyrate hydrolase family protein [Lysobacterales bacterium]